MATLIGIALVGGGLPVVGPARAAVPPMRDRTSATVTADALPTVQINGVVWAQVMIGNVVYAGGEFTTARPAGAPPGVDETLRKNLLAYDITTGELVTRFVPDAFNGRIKTLAVSTDKKTLYVGGSFTKVGLATRGRFAALSAATGALKSPNPSFNNTISALAVNSKTVYAGGAFSAVGSKTRIRLAAINAKSGKLTSWRAKADAGVNALALTSGSKLLVVGGMFKKLNSTSASGSGAVSPKSGKTKTWKVNKVVKNGGKSSGILSLVADGDTVYGGGFTSGTGNFEGVYAASSKDGTLRWLQDCHGDTYGIAPIGSVVYSVGHAHYCSNIGGFPDTDPRAVWYRALAVSKKASGTVAKNGQNTAKTYTNFEGKPAPSLLNWFPQVAVGSYTGMTQGAWSIVGNGKYISLGGEFPSVNGRPQQGLARLTVAANAPNKVGPTGATAMALSATEQGDGAVAVDWGQLWDRDDLTLTYQLSRNGTVIDSRAVSVPFWKRSTMTFLDRGAASDASSTLKYQVTVTDPSGNSVTSSTVRVDRPPRTSDDPTPSPVPTTSSNAGPSDSDETPGVLPPASSEATNAP